jgi:uncharacterized membrane protein HdeD (DUF308 family)
MADNEKKPSSSPQWLLFVFPTILAIIGAYFALTRPAATVKAPPNAPPHSAPSKAH